MSEDPPPWKEVSTDDFHPRTFRGHTGSEAWVASTNRVRELLERQHAGEFRLRLVLRETVDLKPRGQRDPRRLFEYDCGPFATTEAEVVIVLKDGRRYTVTKVPAPWGPAGV